MKRANMLKPMWKRPAWRKPPVRSRYHSPSATAFALQAEVGDHRAAGAAEPAGAGRDLGEVGGDVERDQDDRSPGSRSARARPGPARTWVRWLAHSGQRMPTGVGVMHSGQIGRPQEEQETRVSRSGWR